MEAPVIFNTTLNKNQNFRISHNCESQVPSLLPHNRNTCANFISFINFRSAPYSVCHTKIVSAFLAESQRGSAGSVKKRHLPGTTGNSMPSGQWRPLPLIPEAVVRAICTAAILCAIKKDASA